MVAKVFNIGGKPVGHGHRPLIVAEMSANHCGNLDYALGIVSAAAECGADAIKLQTWRPGSLTINSQRPEFFISDPSSPWYGWRLWDLYEKAHTPLQWHEPIFNAARKAGLACISTAFDPESVEFLLSLSIDAIKIASFELVHIPLIETAAKSGKPVLLSTGMATRVELDDAVATLRASGCDQFILLKCTSAYPSEEASANVLTMDDMYRCYGCNVGLSDHSLRPYSASAAASLGAALIEKHFTLSRGNKGLDSAFSLEPPELLQLVEGINLTWRSLGEIAYGPLDVEESSMKERPSIYVVRSIKKGEPFTQQNVRVIRPANGLPPKYYKSVLGKVSARDIESESPMSWDHVTEH